MRSNLMEGRSAEATKASINKGNNANGKTRSTVMPPRVLQFRK